MPPSGRSIGGLPRGSVRARALNMATAPVAQSTSTPDAARRLRACRMTRGAAGCSAVS
jgi:hypothetical protein